MNFVIQNDEFCNKSDESGSLQVIQTGKDFVDLDMPGGFAFEETVSSCNNNNIMITRIPGNPPFNVFIIISNPATK